MKIIKTKQLIGFFCRECKQHSTKTARYMIRRFKEGKCEMYCSRICADKSHARKMAGQGNPNFNGTFHGVLSTFWSEEKRKQAAAKLSATLKERGSFAGENNPKWAGGSKAHDCVICGKEKQYPPHIHKEITEGKRQPACSNACATALCRRSIKYSATSIELKMKDELERRGLEYIEQYNLGDKFLLDFFLPDYNIVIECDGDYWHTRPEAIRRDKRKNAYVKACGFSMFRFWEREINADVEACVDIVMAKINQKETA